MTTLISRDALFDELAKIAEETSKKPSSVGRVIRSALVAATGGALGYGLSEVAGRNLSFFRAPPPGLSSQDASKLLNRRLSTARFILPILSGTAVMLADRYRQKLNDQYSKIKGFEEQKKNP